MLAIVDYGVGNLFSLKSSLNYIGVECVVSGDAEIIRNSDRVILPGVGAFSDAARKLRESGLDEVVCDEASKGKPVMGICLGMQMLFDKSFEYGEHAGLGLVKGNVIGMKDRIPQDLKIPQIGWNSLQIRDINHPLFKYIKDGDFVYFVHSFFASDCEESVIATTNYGIDMTAIVAKDNVMGCQFHPEKSGSVGLNILKSFCEMKG